MSLEVVFHDEMLAIRGTGEDFITLLEEWEGWVELRLAATGIEPVAMMPRRHSPREGSVWLQWGNGHPAYPISITYRTSDGFTGVFIPYKEATFDVPLSPY